MLPTRTSALRWRTYADWSTATWGTCTPSPMTRRWWGTSFSTQRPDGASSLCFVSCKAATCCQCKHDHYIVRQPYRELKGYWNVKGWLLVTACEALKSVYSWLDKKWNEKCRYMTGHTVKSECLNCCGCTFLFHLCNPFKLQIFLKLLFLVWWNFIAGLCHLHLAVIWEQTSNTVFSLFSIIYLWRIVLFWDLFFGHFLHFMLTNHMKMTFQSAWWCLWRD